MLTIARHHLVQFCSWQGSTTAVSWSPGFAGKKIGRKKTDLVQHNLGQSLVRFGDWINAAI